MEKGLSVFRKLASKLEYEIELTSELGATFAAGIDYGIIEAKWIPTELLGLPIFGRFSYYHVALLILMGIVSFALAWSHLHWLLTDRKKYIIFICLAALSLSVLVEDVTWFICKGKPIAYDEWTMIKPGLGINVGFTWIPLWYILALAFSLTMLYLANKYATKGYQAYIAALKQV
jgi:hypothetical protein